MQMNRNKVTNTLLLVILSVYFSSCGMSGINSSSIADSQAAEQAVLLNQQHQQDHEYFMKQAIFIAKKALKYPFGALIVRRQTGEIVAEGFNRSGISPTYHGEIDAINRCAKTYPSIKWEDMVLYTTAEPCAMCQSAIEWAGISTVYYGTSIPYLKSKGWWQINIRAEEVARRTPFRKTRIVGGILEEECNLLYREALVK